MIEIELEDYLEEVKFQMTELFDDLDKETILRWEEQARAWISRTRDKNVIRYRNSVALMVRDEDVMSDVAVVFRRAFVSGDIDSYWKSFKLSGK